MAAEFNTTAARYVLGNVVNNTVVDVSVQSLKDCQAKIDQRIGVRIGAGSKIYVTGDFIAQQKAVLALECIQTADNVTELVEKVKSKLFENVSTAVRQLSEKKQAKPVDVELIRRIINKNVDAMVEQKCVARVLSAVQIDIQGSEFRVGVCLPEKLKQAEADCLAGIEAFRQGKEATDAQKDACNIIGNECAGKRGNLNIVQNVELSAGCRYLENIVEELLPVLTKLPVSDEQKQKTKVNKLYLPSFSSLPFCFLPSF